MCFLRAIFHYCTQITPFENGGHTVWMDYKQKIPKFARNHWGNVFMKSLFHYYTQITPLENGGHAVWMNYKQPIRSLHEFTEAMGFMRLLFHFYTQITPLENGGHTVCMDYKQIIPKFVWNHWGNGFYNVHFPLLHTNHPLGKRGPHSFNGLQAKKIQNLHETTKSISFMTSLFHKQITNLDNGEHTVWMDYKQQISNFARNQWANGFYEVAFPLLHTNHPLGKRGPHSFNGLQATNFEIVTKPLR